MQESEETLNLCTEAAPLLEPPPSFLCFPASTQHLHPHQGWVTGSFQTTVPSLPAPAQVTVQGAQQKPAVLGALLQPPQLLPQPHKREPAAVAAPAGYCCAAALAIIRLSALRFMTTPSFILLQSKHFTERHQELTESSDSDWRHSSRRKTN